MPCVRCGGAGTILQYIKVRDGVCFRCNGSGAEPGELGILTPTKIHKETIIDGIKLVLTTKKDPHGRFMGYEVYVAGTVNLSLRRTYRNIKEAGNALNNLKKQVQAAKKDKNITLFTIEETKRLLDRGVDTWKM